MNHIVTVKYEKGQEPKIELIEVPDKKKLLEQMYENIGCTTVELVSLPLYDCWVNEEGLFNSGSPVYHYGNATLAGNLVFTKGVDSQGETLLFDVTYDFGLILDIFKMVTNAQYAGEVR